MDFNVTKGAVTSSLYQGGVKVPNPPVNQVSSRQMISITPLKPNSSQAKGYPDDEHSYAKPCNTVGLAMSTVPLITCTQGGNVRLSPLQVATNGRPLQVVPPSTPNSAVQIPHPLFPGAVSPLVRPVRPSNTAFSLILDAQALKSLKGNRAIPRLILEPNSSLSSGQIQSEQSGISPQEKSTDRSSTLTVQQRLPYGEMSIPVPTNHQRPNQNVYISSRASRRKQDLIARKPMNFPVDPHTDDKTVEDVFGEKVAYGGQRGSVGAGVQLNITPVTSGMPVPAVSVTPMAQRLLKTLIRDPARCISDSQSLQQIHCQLQQVDFVRKTLTAIRDLPDNCIVSEYVGVVRSFEEYDATCSYQLHYNPYVLFYQVEQKSFCIDASNSSHFSRHLNRSCTPNCYMTHVFCEGLPRFVICTRDNVSAGEELTIGFDFDYSLCQYPVRCACGRSACPVTDSNLHKTYKNSPEFGQSMKSGGVHSLAGDNAPLHGHKKNRTTSQEKRTARVNRKQQNPPRIKREVDVHSTSHKKLSSVVEDYESFVSSPVYEEVEHISENEHKKHKSSKQVECNRKRTNSSSYTERSSEEEHIEPSTKKVQAQTIDREMRKDLARIRLAMREEKLREERQRRKEKQKQSKQREREIVPQDDEMPTDELLMESSHSISTAMKKEDDEKENVHSCGTEVSEGVSMEPVPDSPHPEEMVHEKQPEDGNKSHSECDGDMRDSAFRACSQLSHSQADTEASSHPAEVSEEMSADREEHNSGSEDESSGDESSSSYCELEDAQLIRDQNVPDMKQQEESRSRKKKHRGRQGHHGKPFHRRQSSSTSATDMPSSASSRKRNFEYSDDSSLFRTKRGRAFAEMQRKLLIELERQKKLEKIMELESQNPISSAMREIGGSKDSLLSPTHRDENHSESEKKENIVETKRACSLIVYKSPDENPMAKFSRGVSVSFSVTTNAVDEGNSQTQPEFAPTSPLPPAPPSSATATVMQFGSPPPPDSLVSPPSTSTPFPFTKKRWLTQAIWQQQQQAEPTIPELPSNAEVFSFDKEAKPEESHVAQPAEAPDYAPSIVNHNTSASVFFASSSSVHLPSAVVNPKKRLMVQYSELQSQLQENRDVLPPEPPVSVVCVPEVSDVPEKLPEVADQMIVQSVDTASSLTPVDIPNELKLPPKKLATKSTLGTVLNKSKISLTEYKMRRLLSDQTPFPLAPTDNEALVTTPPANCSGVVVGSPDVVLEEDLLPDLPPPPLHSLMRFVSSDKRTLHWEDKREPSLGSGGILSPIKVDSFPESSWQDAVGVFPAEVQQQSMQDNNPIVANIQPSTPPEDVFSNSCGPATPSEDAGECLEDKEDDVMETVQVQCAKTPPPHSVSENVGNLESSENVMQTTGRVANPLPNKSLDESTLPLQRRPSESDKFDELIVRTSQVEDPIVLEMRQRDDEIRDYQELKVLERQKQRLLQEIISVERNKQMQLQKQAKECPTTTTPITVAQVAMLSSTIVISSALPMGRIAPVTASSPPSLPLTSTPIALQSGQSVSREKRVLLPTPLLPTPTQAVPLLNNQDTISNPKDRPPTSAAISLPLPEFLEKQFIRVPPAPVAMTNVNNNNAMKRPLLGFCPPSTSHQEPPPMPPLSGPHMQQHFTEQPIVMLTKEEMRNYGKRRRTGKGEKRSHSKRYDHSRDRSHRRRHSSRRAKRRRRRSSSSSSSGSSSSTDSSSSRSDYSSSSYSTNSSRNSYHHHDYPQSHFMHESVSPRMLFSGDPSQMDHFVESEELQSQKCFPARSRYHLTPPQSERFSRPYPSAYPGHPPFLRPPRGASHYQPRGWKPQNAGYHNSRGGYRPGGGGARYHGHFHPHPRGASLQPQQRH